MEIKPFRAVRYNPDAVGDVGSCISPPYDVINSEQQEQLYQKNPCNIVRVIKGKTEPNDNEGENQYTRAAEYLNKWIDEGILKQDQSETIYGYVQDFQRAGRSYQRFSFIALAKLEQFGSIVRPHERVLNDPIVDRLKLKKATEAGFGLIFVLYEDKDGTADKIIAEAVREKSLIDFTDEQGVRHRLYPIPDDEDIDSIVEMMHDKSCIIADGHHRYTTALSYLEQSTNPAARYLMLAFANTCHEGLIVLATHRLLANLDGFGFEQLLDGLSADFEIIPYAFDSPQTKTDAKQQMLVRMKDEFDGDRSAFGIYAADGAFYVATLKNKSAMDAVAPGTSDAWKSLDVAVLHKLILEKAVGLDEAKVAAGGNVQYVKDTIDAINESITAVDDERKQVAFFMNPPRIEQMQMVADNGERMPQKSTYFFPKVYTGLTINKM